MFTDVARTARDNLLKLRDEAVRLQYELPGTPYRTLSEADRDTFAPVLDVWKPQDGQEAVILRWFMTEWCNYGCPYCTQTHNRDAAKGKGFTAHGFDNFPLVDWLRAIERHFTDRRLSLLLTGGEPFVDRKAMLPFLGFLTEFPNTECIRIDTNGWWKPDPYLDLDKSKITLMCTFHPSQVSAERFFSRLEAILDAGFRIGMVNYVMNADNLPRYLEFKDALRGKGIPLHPNPLWGARGQYSREDLELLQRELSEADFRYRGGASPRGKKCLFPSVSYELDYKGNVHVGCHPAASGSFFDETLPRLFAGPVPCPYTSCVCLDKYSFLGEINRNVGLDPLKIYGDRLRGARRLANA